MVDVAQPAAKGMTQNFFALYTLTCSIHLLCYGTERPSTPERSSSSRGRDTLQLAVTLLNHSAFLCLSSSRTGVPRARISMYTLSVHVGNESSNIHETHECRVHWVLTRLTAGKARLHSNENAPLSDGSTIRPKYIYGISEDQLSYNLGGYFASISPLSISHSNAASCLSSYSLSLHQCMYTSYFSLLLLLWSFFVFYLLHLYFC